MTLPQAPNDNVNQQQSMPVIIDQLIKNGQPQFGVFAGVKQINFLDYHSHLISQKPISNRRKQFKANQFAFIQIVHSPYRICIAVASIKIASSAFVYLYNEQTDTMEVVEALRPLMQEVDFEGDHYQGRMSFIHPKLSVHLVFKPDQVNVNLQSRQFDLSAQLQRQDQPLSVCTPAGRRGWTFTQKEPFTSVAGKLLMKPASLFYSNMPEEVVAFDEQTLANLDWTLGFMRHETNWFWCCINSYLADGRHFLLNLSMGVNETGMGENACWIDGEIHYLPPVLFRRQTQSNSVKANSPANDWQIGNQNLGWSNIDIELTFTPIKVYQKTDNFVLIASIFEQWVGHYSGEIRLKNEVIRLDNILGLAEDHFAKW